MVFSVLDQLQVFSQLYLVALLGLLTGLGLLELWCLIYPRLLTGFDMLVFFTRSSLMEFQVIMTFGLISSFTSKRLNSTTLSGSG